jgi:hypothetical protein
MIQRYLKLWTALQKYIAGQFLQRRKQLPTRCNLPQFAAICRILSQFGVIRCNLPQLAAIRRNSPQFVSKSPHLFFVWWDWISGNPGDPIY